ncbi:MAG: class I SAM-dependent methyltransferase [bacterium]
MDSEKEYYEEESFWDGKDVSSKEVKRIVATCKLIPKDVKSLVDIGCGNGIFVNYILKNKGDIKCLGIDRSITALKYVMTSKTKGDITHIPLKDRSYDLSCALEVIEHLDNEGFEKALDELARVSKKYVIISVPNNEILENNFIRCPDCQSLFSASLHKRRFNQDKMKSLLMKFGFRPRKIIVIGEKTEYFFISPLFYYLNRFFLRKNPKYPYVFLICGHKNKNMLRLSKNLSKNKLVKPRRLMVKCLDIFWPKRTKYRWILALYQRV